MFHLNDKVLSSKLQPQEPQNGHSGVGQLPSGSVDLDRLAQELVDKTPPQFRGAASLDIARWALKEWIVDSGISPDTALANLSLLQGQAFLDLVTAGVAETIHKKFPNENHLARYQGYYRGHCAQGAWGFFGLKVEKDRSPDGSYTYRLLANTTHPIIKFKKPRVNAEGDPIKYENFAYREAFPLLPYVSKTAVEELAVRYNEIAGKKRLVFKMSSGDTFDKVPVNRIWTGDVLTSSLNYWQFVRENPFILVAITEGAKKACSLMDIGVPTICLRGITIWRQALFPENDWEYHWEVERECEAVAIIGRLSGTPLKETIRIQNNIKETKKYDWLQKTLDEQERLFSLLYESGGLASIEELEPDFREQLKSSVLDPIEKDLREQIKKGSDLAYPIGYLNQEKRPFAIVFDSDPPYKLKTRKNVTAQSFALANQIAAPRAAKSKGFQASADAFKAVRILHWSPDAGKGIDDYLMRYPTLGDRREAFDALYKKNFLTASEVEKKNKRYKAQERRIKTYQLVTQLRGDEKDQKIYPNLRTLTLPPNGKLPPLSGMDAELQKVITQEGGVVLLQSPVSSGKTHFLNDIRKRYLAGEIPLAGLSKEQKPFFLAITPTNSLGRQLRTRLNESVPAPEKYNVATLQDHADRLARLCFLISKIDCYQNLSVVLQMFGSLACDYDIRTVDASTLQAWNLGREFDDARILIIKFFLYLDSLIQENAENQHKLCAVLHRLYRRLVSYFGFPYNDSSDDPELPAPPCPLLEEALQGDLTRFFRPLLDFAAIEVSKFYLVIDRENKSTQFVHRADLEEQGKLPDCLGMVTCAEGLTLYAHNFADKKYFVPPHFNSWMHDIHNDAILRDHSDRVARVLNIVGQVYEKDRIILALREFGRLACIEDLGEAEFSTLLEWNDDARVLIIEFFMYLESLIQENAENQPKLCAVLNRLYRTLVGKFKFPYQDESDDPEMPAPPCPLLEEALKGRGDLVQLELLLTLKQSSEASRMEYSRFFRPLLEFAASEVSNFKVVMFIDEIEYVVTNLVSGRTTSPEMWGKAMTLFQKLLSRSKLVIGAQANLSPDVVKFIRAFSGKEPHIRVFNYSAPPSNVGKITFHWGSRSSARDTGAFALQLMQSLIEGKRIFVATTSKIAAQQMWQFLSSHLPGYRIMEVDADNAGEDIHLQLFNNPNEFLTTHKPHVLIVSPCVKTGVSIDCDYFDEVWGLFASGTPHDIVQMLGRVRSKVDRHVWVSEYFCSSEHAWSEYGTRKHSELVKRVAQENRELYESCYENDNPYLADEVKSPQVRYRRFTQEQVEALDAVYAASKLKTNYGNFAPAHILIDMYNQWGWTIEHKLLGSTPPTDTFLNQLDPVERENPFVVEQEWKGCLTKIGEKWFEAKKIIIDKTAEDMFVSELVAEDEVSLVLSSSKSTRMQRLGARKAQIYHGLEGIEQYEEEAQTDDKKYDVLVALFRQYLKTRGRFIKGPKILAQAFALDACDAKTAKKLANLTQWGNINPAHIPMDSRRARFLNKVGFVRFLQKYPSGTGYTTEAPEVQELIKNLKENAEEFKRLFGLSITDDQFGMRMIGNLLRWLGLNHKSIKRKGSDGHRVYVYAITSVAPEWELVFSRHLDWLQKDTSSCVTFNFAIAEGSRGDLDAGTGENTPIDRGPPLESDSEADPPWPNDTE